MSWMHRHLTSTAVTEIRLFFFHPSVSLCCSCCKKLVVSSRPVQTVHRPFRHLTPTSEASSPTPTIPNRPRAASMRHFIPSRDQPPMPARLHPFFSRSFCSTRSWSWSSTDRTADHSSPPTRTRPSCRQGEEKKTFFYTVQFTQNPNLTFVVLCVWRKDIEEIRSAITSLSQAHKEKKRISPSACLPCYPPASSAQVRHVPGPPSHYFLT
jgi:hypothetical protein